MTQAGSVTTTHRPWGQFQVLAACSTFKLKRIVVSCGQRLSLQRHQHRREHWYVLEGQADVYIDGTLLKLCSGQSVDIPALAWHRLANDAQDDVVLIEIQAGSYFGEDDIERRADDYGRVEASSEAMP